MQPKRVFVFYVTMITANQVKAARQLLSWTRQHCANEAGVWFTWKRVASHITDVEPLKISSGSDLLQNLFNLGGGGGAKRRRSEVAKFCNI